MSSGVIASSRLLGLSGGGGSLTETAFSDFKNAVYRLDGSTVTVGDIWQQDTNWGTWVAGTAISAGVGYVGFTSCAPTMKTTAFDIVCPGNAGFVAVVDLVISASTNQWQMDLIELPGFSQDASAQIGLDYIYLQTWNGGFGGFDDDTGVLAAGSRRIVIRFTETNITVKTMEGVTVTTAASTNSSPAFTTIAMNMGFDSGSSHVVEAVTFYDVSADLDAALAA